jgi:ABC-type branched-subunit amino acid transport system ATPase component
MAISVEHFSRTYGDLTAVDDLAFEVASGEIVGLIGPTGRGRPPPCGLSPAFFGRRPGRSASTATTS